VPVCELLSVLLWRVTLGCASVNDGTTTRFDKVDVLNFATFRSGELAAKGRAIDATSLGVSLAFVAFHERRHGWFLL
jgi:hypothetical protein